MTDERIEELANGLREHVENLFKFPFDEETGENLEPALMDYEIADVASEVERAFVKILYLIEFKKLRAKGWKT